jgi:hypothetical protein|tara:strand:- start:681 stop:872 length:192 start_codon:yes stop_codon:yes gene_type:complete
MAFGWFLCRVIKKDTSKFDRILAWDQNVLAWRVVPEGSRLVRNKRYLAAAEIADINEDGGMSV